MNDHEVLARLIDDAVEYRRGESYDDLEDEDDLGEDELADRAWGLFQFLRGTWNSVCPEFPHGSATVEQQVECARRLWDNGRGRSHWALADQYISLYDRLVALLSQEEA